MVESKEAAAPTPAAANPANIQSSSSQRAGAVRTAPVSFQRSSMYSAVQMWSGRIPAESEWTTALPASPFAGVLAIVWACDTAMGKAASEQAATTQPAFGNTSEITLTAQLMPALLAPYPGKRKTSLIRMRLPVIVRSLNGLV